MSYHFTPTGALTDASQTASIAEIKTKTDKIIIDLSSSNLNLNTMNNDLTAAAVINNTQNAQLAMTTGSNMKTAIDLNSAKIGITASQSNIINANANKLNMTVASAMKTAVDGNSSSITTLNLGTEECGIGQMPRNRRWLHRTHASRSPSNQWAPIDSPFGRVELIGGAD